MQSYAGAFVVGTGRCGSTLLSNALALDSDTLSLSELFFCLHPEAFPPGVISGRELWSILAARSGGASILMNIGAEPPEFLYSLKGGGHRFDRSSGVPRILCVTLPAICEDHEALYDRLAEAVPSYPVQTAAEHYHQLFMHLAHWLGRSRWVERSGASGFFADQLVENFPEARFIHLTRGTDATARSMAKHSVFRLIALRSEFIRRCGTDVFDSTDVLDNPGDLPGMPPDLADLLPGRLSRESLAAWEPGINTFRMLVSFQRNRIKAALKRVPENQVLLVRYEDLLDNATFEFERIATFLGLAHPPGWAKQAAALVRRPAPAGSSPRQ